MFLDSFTLAHWAKIRVWEVKGFACVYIGNVRGSLNKECCGLHKGLGASLHAGMLPITA